MLPDVGRAQSLPSVGKHDFVGAGGPTLEPGSSWTTPVRTFEAGAHAGIRPRSCARLLMKGVGRRDYR